MLKIAYFEARQERVQSLGRAIGEFYFHKRQDFCASTGPFFLGWIAEALEVYVIISYQGGPAWLSLASLSPPSPFFHQKPRLLHSWQPRCPRRWECALLKAFGYSGITFVLLRRSRTRLDRNGMSLPVIAEKNGMSRGRS